MKCNDVAWLRMEPPCIADVKLGNLKVLASGSDVCDMISWTREGVIRGCKVLYDVV